MDKRRFQQILEKIAKTNHMTSEEVRHEMQIAMDAGLSSSDPEVQARWQTIPRKGEKLTLEEFIDYAATEVSSLMS